MSNRETGQWKGHKSDNRPAWPEEFGARVTDEEYPDLHNAGVGLCGLYTAFRPDDSHFSFVGKLDKELRAWKREYEAIKLDLSLSRGHAATAEKNRAEAEKEAEAAKAECTELARLDWKWKERYEAAKAAQNTWQEEAERLKRLVENERKRTEEKRGDCEITQRLLDATLQQKKEVTRRAERAEQELKWTSDRAHRAEEEFQKLQAAQTASKKQDVQPADKPAHVITEEEHRLIQRAGEIVPPYPPEQMPAWDVILRNGLTLYGSLKWEWTVNQPPPTLAQMVGYFFHRYRGMLKEAAEWKAACSVSERQRDEACQNKAKLAAELSELREVKATMERETFQPRPANVTDLPPASPDIDTMETRPDEWNPKEPPHYPAEAYSDEQRSWFGLEVFQLWHGKRHKDAFNYSFSSLTPLYKLIGYYCRAMRYARWKWAEEAHVRRQLIQEVATWKERHQASERAWADMHARNAKLVTILKDQLKALEE